MASNFQIDWSRVTPPTPIQPISPIPVAGPMDFGGYGGSTMQRSAPQGIDWSKVTPPEPIAPQSPIPRSTQQAPLEVSLSNVNMGDTYEAPEWQPHIPNAFGQRTTDIQLQDPNRPIDTTVKLPQAPTGQEASNILKGGIIKGLSAPGVAIDKVNYGLDAAGVGDEVRGAVDWAVTPWFPEEEKAVIDFAGRTPLVGPLAKKAAEFVVGGSTAPLGILGVMTGGTGLKVGAKVARYAAPRLAAKVGSMLSGAGKVGSNAGKASEIIEELHPAEKTLIEAIPGAEYLTNQQTHLYNKERSNRIQNMLKLDVMGKGEEGFAAQKAALSGALPKVPFESIRGKFSDDDIKFLYDKIELSKLSPLDKVTAKEGLNTMLGGDLAGVPEFSELKNLQKVFPGLKVPHAKENIVTEMGNLSRTVMSTGDIESFPLRQGATLVSRREFWKSIPKGMKSVSTKNYKEVMKGIEESPRYILGRDYAGLDITDINDVAKAEESFSSGVARLPGFRNAAQAYSGNANALRQGLFDELVDKFEKLGRNMDPASPNFDAKLVKELGDYVNAATGRGNLGKLEKSARLINATIFAPRLVSSRLGLMRRVAVDPWKAPINMVLGKMGKVPYDRIDPLIRKEAWRDALAFGGVQLAMLTGIQTGRDLLSDATGHDIRVGTESTSTDYGKVKIDNSRLDFNGGFQPYVRALAQLAQQATTSSVSGKKNTLEEGYKPETSYDIIQKLATGKESPLASFVTNFLQGEDLAGRPVTMSSEMRQKLSPIILQDLITLLQEDPSLLPLIVPANFGAGLQTYGASEIRRQPKKSNEYEVTLPPIKTPQFRF